MTTLTIDGERKVAWFTVLQNSTGKGAMTKFIFNVTFIVSLTEPKNRLA